MPAAKTKKEETVDLSIPLKGVKAKLQAARVALAKTNLSKTGKNDFAHFEFFQLKDFLPKAQEIFTKIGLHSEYTIMPRVIAYKETIDGNNIIKEPIIREIAQLVIKDIESDEEEIYSMEVQPVVIGNNTKQNIYQAAGGRSTYYKRYLYRDALEIEEDDESDQVLGQQDVNYVEPNVQETTPYNFQQPVSTSIQQDIVNTQQAPMQQTVDMGTPVTISPDNGQVNTQQENVNPDDILSQDSRVEVMNIINGKNLNGFEVINKYCEMNQIPTPSDLKEKDKIGLLDYINNL